MLRRLLSCSASVAANQLQLSSSSFQSSLPLAVTWRPRPVFDWVRFQHSDKDTFSDELDVKRHEGAQLLRSLNAYSFREHLRDLSEERMRLTFKELNELARQHGAAATPQESRALCDALVASGVIFRYRDVVYLSTDDVAEMLLTCLPDSEMEFKKRVEKLEQELRPLEIQKQDIEEGASKLSTYILWGGLSFLVLQFGIFVRLTFWELSWDVMEPVSYFVSLAYGIAIYLYFLLSNENFEYNHVRDRLRSYFRKKGASRFDYERYQKLTRELARYQKYLARCRA